jgi:hypothetical protein
MSDPVIRGCLLRYRGGDAHALDVLADHLEEQDRKAAADLLRGHRLLRREVKFDSAYHRVHDDPRKNFGVGSVHVRFLLEGPEGALTYVALTEWHLDETYAWWESRGLNDRLRRSSLPVACYPAVYHSPRRLTEDDHYRGSHQGCEYLGGAPCYSGDTSGYADADQLFEVLVREGDGPFWAAFEAQYREVFRGEA